MLALEREDGHELTAMRFQDAAKDARAVVYAGIQADPLVARLARLTADATQPQRLLARAVMNGESVDPETWRAIFPTVLGPDAPDRERAEEILAASLEVAGRGEQVRSQFRGAFVEELTQVLVARRLGPSAEPAVRRERRVLFDGVAAEIIYPSVGMVLCNHPDPDYKHACMWAYNRWLQDDSSSLNRQTNIVKSYVPPSSLSQGIGARPASATPRTIAQRAPDPAYVAQRQAVNAALRVANTPGVDPSALSAAAASLDAAYAGKVPDYVMRQFDAMAQNAENIAGSALGTRVLVSNVDGKLQWVDATQRSLDSYGPTGKVAGSALEPRMEQAGVDPSKPGATKVVDVIVDVRGVPKHVKAVATLAGSDLSVWRVGSKGLPMDVVGDIGKDLPAGSIITSDVLKVLDERRPGWRNAAGDKASGSIIYKGLADEGAYYRVVLAGGTDRNGQPMAPETWTQDPGTNQWTKG